MRGLLAGVGLAAAMAVAGDAQAQEAEAALLARTLTGINLEIGPDGPGARQTGAVLSTGVDTCRLSLFWSATGADEVLDLGQVDYVWGWSTDDVIELRETSSGPRVFIFEIGAERYRETRSAFEGLATICGSTLGEPQLYEAVGFPSE